MQLRPWPMAVIFVYLSVLGPSAPAMHSQQQSKPVRASGSDGFVAIFDGRTLDGWHAVPKESAPDWTVRDGMIVGQGSVDRASYLVWKDAHLTDFELTLRYRLPGKANTGVDIRSHPDPTGKRSFESYHADLGHVGIGPHILGAWDFHFAKRKEYPCPRGTRLVIDEDGKPHSSALRGAITVADIRAHQWNDVHIIARGNHFQLFINGKPASEFTDNARRGRLEQGAIGLQIHDKGMRVEFKDVRLKRLPSASQSEERVAAGGAAVKETIEINGLPVTPDALPDGLVIPDGLGLLTTPKLSGKLIYEGENFTDDPRAIITPGGDYLLMFPAGAHYARKRTKCNQMLAFRSSDKGKAWTGPKVAFDIDYSQHGFVPLIPQGSKRIYAFGTQPIPDMREGNENSPIGFRYSDDDGHTWSEVTLIKPVNDPGFKGMSCMRMCQTGSGAWLIGSHAADWGVRPLKTRQYVLRSEDRGATWTVAPKPRHEGWFVEKFNRMDEGRPISLGGSKVLLMCRTPEGHLWNARSEDDGKTWTRPEATPLVHPDAPPMLFHLSDGKTLAAFHHNRHHDLNYTTLDSGKVEMMKDRQEIWVAFSKDDGKTWSEPRFVFANAITKKLQNAWWTYNCSYIDTFVDGGVCNIFVPHRWSRQLHLQIAEKELFRLPTRDELKKMLQE